MKLSRPGIFAAAFLALTVVLVGVASGAGDCGRAVCPEVSYGNGSLEAAYLAKADGGIYIATNQAAPDRPYTYRLSEPCVVNDRETGGCNRADFLQCTSPPGRVVEDLVIERRRLAIPGQDGTTTTADGFPTSGAPVGTPVGTWLPLERGCVDITALNPAPSPGEVFRYFQTLPLPQLPTRQQPPGNGLVGLPVIFFTDGPTTQTFTLN